MFGIFTSRAMRERGRYQLQLMKTRNSGGVGQKIDLEFDLDTLRIRDCDDDDDDSGNTSGYTSGSQNTNSIVSNLKRQNTQDPNANPSDGETVKNTKADVDSTKLRSFINNLGSDE